MKNIVLIAAISENNCIGKDSTLPWKLQDDLRLFSNLTKTHSVIMGRKNYDSIGKALPNRHNIVITRNKQCKIQDCDVVHSLKDAIQIASGTPFIIGGADIYKAALPFCTHFFRTTVHANIDGDTFFPEYNKSEWESCYSSEYSSDNGNDYKFTFELLKRKL